MNEAYKELIRSVIAELRRIDTFEASGDAVENARTIGNCQGIAVGQAIRLEVLLEHI
jgi:hypothetical protein